MTPLSQRLNAKYPNTISFKQVLEDPLILDNLPKKYIPQIQTYDRKNYTEYFINTEIVTDILQDGIYKSKFFYFTPQGAHKSFNGMSFYQVGPKLEGYLLRATIPAQNKTEPALMLDYLIDLSAIQYNIESSMNTIKNKDGEDMIVSDESITFLSAMPKTSELLRSSTVVIYPFDENSKALSINMFETDASRNYIINCWN